MSSRKALISVDLDYFNHADIKDMTHILAVVMAAGIRRCTIQKDHLPESYNAWPGRKAWKNYTIWNYDEHDDYAKPQGGIEEIGTWAHYLANKGALIKWVTEPEHAYKCGADCHDSRISQWDSYSNPLPSPDDVEGLAFFTSPGYLENEDLIFHMFDLAHTFDFKVNGRLATNWTVGQIRNIQ